MEPLILALDFGGTKLTAGLARPASRSWLQIERTLSPKNKSRDTDMDLMDGLVARLMQNYEPEAIGISFGGPVDFENGMALLSHHVPGWKDEPLAEIFANKYGIPVVIDNDANAAAYGEYRNGAGAGSTHLFFITISTGVGGGWILDGRPWRGATGLAGEIGHMVVDPQGPLCLCGKRGCVERLASGPYMASDYLDALKLDLDEPALAEKITGKRVAEAAGQGDQLAKKFLLRGANALGLAIGNTANLVNPQRFVLGGGVTKSGEEWWHAVRSAAFDTALPEVRNSFKIVPAEMGDEAPLWGAACLAADFIFGMEDR